MATRTPDVQDPARENGISPRADDDTPAAADGVTGVPDEPGPRDVPDDKVIEKTLPDSAGRQERGQREEH